LLAYASALQGTSGSGAHSNGWSMIQDITTTTELQGMSIAGPHLGSGQSINTRPTLLGGEKAISWPANIMLATTLTLLLFSAAGIPPLVGFFAKYQVISSALSSGYFYISLVTILASLISSVYYLRVIRAI